MKKAFIILILGLLFSSSDKFLTPKSQHEFVPEEAESLNEMLLAEGYLMGNGINDVVSGLQIGDFMSDDVSTCNLFPVDLNSMGNNIDELVSAYGWNYDDQIIKDEQTLGTSWVLLYKKIKGCNAAMDYLNTVSGSESEKQFIEGQALFLRSFYFFILVNLYGQPYTYDPQSLGVPLKLISSIETEGLKRNTVKEVYDQIVSDLLKAESYFLSLSSSKQFAKNYTVNLPVIQTLLSRVYLFMEKWDEAAEYAQKVLTNNQFELLDLNDITYTYNDWTNYKNPEVIWGWGSPQDYNSTILYSTLKSGYKGFIVFTPSTELLNLYETDDLRPDFILKDPSTRTHLVCRGKIVANYSYRVQVSTSIMGHAIRLSEAYLNYAEACLMKDEKDESQAIWALETLREKKFKKGSNYLIPSTNKSGEALLQFCKEERRREFCFEGFRWMDLRRWGMPSFSRIFDVNSGEQFKFTLQKNDPAYTFPIPENVLEQNLELKQNELPKDHQTY